LSAEGIRPLLEHSGAELIFIGKLDQYASQKPGVADELIKITFPSYGVEEGMKWDDLLEKHAPLKNMAVHGEEDIATIMYSSGTTGTPKGVMLSHQAFGHVGRIVADNLKLTSQDRFFSYLPLSHIAERALMEMVALTCGGTISFAESLDVFVQNLQHEKPTIFGGVPRIYMKFQEGVLSKLPQKKLETLLKIPIIRSLIKKKIQKGLGLDSVRVIVCGAAPSPLAMLEWYHNIGLPIAEIYGMTENAAFSHANYRSIKLGSVGQPWPGVDVRIGDDSEIQLRHKALMKGYYKDDETTKSVMTADGFLKTGDEGYVDDDGFLFITGRVKDQFKTDKGKFIAPGPLELQLLNNTDLAQVCVVGMGIPQPIALALLSPAGRQKPREEITRSLEATLALVNDKVESYERIEKIVIMKDEWTQENGLLTPSLKLKRNELERLHLPKYSHWYRLPGQVLYE
jgi:long-chain acyl-CoA synthetase